MPITTERNELSGRVLEIRCVPVEGGAHLNTYVDVTDQRRAVTELKRAHSTLEAFIKHAPAAVAMFDTDMRYVAHTDRWLHDYDLPDQSLTGRSHYDVFPEVPEHWKVKHQRILAGATESCPEEVFRRADGSTNIIRWEVRPWHLEDGTIGGMMMLTEEISERKQLEQQLWNLAKQDSLTGLPNRLQFNELLGSMLQAAGDTRKFAVGLIDVDRFKETNDILGHAAGDDLLKEVAARLQSALAPYGRVARLGGDEFAVLMSVRDDRPALQQAIDAIFASLKRPVSVGGMQHRCTISMGISLYPADAQGASELLKNADLALYRAKDLGRDRFQFYVPEMRASFETTYQLHRDIQRALSAGELRLVYQPIISFDPVAAGLLRGAAALGPSASRPAVTRRVRCHFRRSRSARPTLASGWSTLRYSRRGSGCVRVSTSVASPSMSPRPISHSVLFADFVRVKLRECSVAPERLCIEVTERVFLGRSAEGVAVTLQKLHDIGVEIALDDFGTGFGSLSHLKKLPIDRLKVDRSFVRDMETNPDNMAIVRTIAHLGQSLGIKVTVEGVETQSQLTLLRAMGCDTMQGYLFAKPMEAAQVEAYLGGRRALSA